MCRVPLEGMDSRGRLNFEILDVGQRRMELVIPIDLVVLWKPEEVVPPHKKCGRVRKWEGDTEMSWLPFPIWRLFT